jgi:hypothetical protein
MTKKLDSLVQRYLFKCFGNTMQNSSLYQTALFSSDTLKSNSMAFEDLEIKFAGLSRTKPISRDITGPGISMKKCMTSKNFARGVRTLFKRS